MVVTLIVWHLINRTFYVVQSETYDLHVLFVPHRPLVKSYLNTLLLLNEANKNYTRVLPRVGTTVRRAQLGVIHKARPGRTNRVLTIAKGSDAVLVSTV